MEERLAKINQDIKNAGGPKNKWDYGKYKEMCENDLKEARKRLDDYKRETIALENKLRSRGIDEIEIQKNIYGPQYSMGVYSSS